MISSFIRILRTGGVEQLSAKWFSINKNEIVIGGVQTLITRSGEVTIPPNSHQDIIISIPYRNYEVRTIRASNDTNSANIVVRLFDSFERKEIYESHEQNNIYDIINIPVEDVNSSDSNVGNIYLRIANLSSRQISSSYEIKILNLRMEDLN